MLKVCSTGFRGGWGDGINDTGVSFKVKAKTNQQANKRAPSSLVKMKGHNVTLKQALQARAALYGYMLDPAWFCNNFYLRSKD